jgi:hypothetical protein
LNGQTAARESVAGVRGKTEGTIEITGVGVEKDPVETQWDNGGRST